MALAFGVGLTRAVEANGVSGAAAAYVTAQIWYWPRLTLGWLLSVVVLADRS